MNDFEDKNNNQWLIKGCIYILLLFILSFILGQIIIKCICDNFAPFLSCEIKSQSIISNKNLNILRLVQAISCFFNFILPSIIFSKVISKNPLNFLQLKKPPDFKSFLLIIAFIISIMPLMNIIIEWNEAIKFPDALKHIETSMREMENSSKNIINQILSGSSIGDLAISIFVVAVLPAIGEELFFRGILQNHLTLNRINYHIAIFIASFVFSAIHFQFYGFIPRLILGQIFGYMLFFSKSLWTSIFAHFINNAIAITAMFITRNSIVNEDSLKSGYGNYDTIILIIASTGAFFIAKYAKKKYYKKQIIK